MRSNHENRSFPPVPKADLVCFSHLRWDFVTQRPQHLLKRAGKDRRVFFWEEPFFHAPGNIPAAALSYTAGSLGLEPTGKATFALERMATAEANVTVLRPHFVHGVNASEVNSLQERMLRALLRRSHADRFVAWYYTPMARSFTQSLSPAATVYDCMDELSAFHGAPPALIEMEQDLFRAADIVFTGGSSLYEAKRKRHENVHSFPSSVEVRHFARAAGGQDLSPADQQAIPHPRAGFYGVLDERFDLKLLEAVADLRPSVSFVLLGPIAKIDPATLPRRANIHYLGGKRYEDLPAYLSGWDMALLPFAKNEATRYISPTKTPEYLAAGKRVISTSIQDVVRGYGDCGLVEICDTPADFAAAMDRALQPPPAGWRKAVEQKLALTSWDSTWARMDAELERVCAAKAHAASPAPVGGKSRLTESVMAAGVGPSAASSMIAGLGDAQPA